MSKDAIYREDVLRIIDRKTVRGKLQVAREVLKLPSADVQPVVHGEWVVSHIPDSMLWECNQCGFDCGAHSFNFCPKCGCKMDRKGADE